MQAPFADTVARLRNPQYTGENRCVPCTVLNVVIAAVAAAILAIVVPLDGAGAAVVGGAALLTAAAVIYLRGYLLPGTPWFTRTYFPDWVLRYFDHHEPTPQADDVEPAEVLETVGAVTECEDVDDLCLTDGFREAWHARIAHLRDTDTSRPELAGILGIPVEALAVEPHGDAFIAMADGGEMADEGFTGRRRVGQWESRGAFLADVAGARVIGERYEGWDRLSPRQRGQVLNGLRIFLDRCPSCDGTVSIGEETVRSCCRSKEVVAVTCEDCGDRLFEAEQPAAA